MKKTGGLFYNCCIILFAILFLAVYSLSIFINRKSALVVPTILCVTFIIIMLFCKYKLNKESFIKKVLNSKYTIIFVLLLACGLRLVSAIVFKNMTQISDFNRAYTVAENLEFLNYHRLFTHWILLPIILHPIFAIFSHTQIVLSIFNTIVSLLTCFIIYLIVNKISNKNRFYSILASCIYAFYPSSILYINVCTGEHIASFMFCMSILLLFYITDKNITFKIKLLLAVAIGLILGVADSFKPFSLIILVATLIYLFLDVLFKKYNFKLILKQCFYFILIILSFFVTKQILFNYYENLLDNTVSRGAASWTLNIGLNSKSKGFWNQDITREYYYYLEKYDYNFKKVDKIVYANLKKDIKKNKKALLYNILPKKLQATITQDTAIPWWVGTMQNNKNLKQQLFGWITNISDLYYLSMTIFITFGIITIARKKFAEENLKYIFLYIIIFGFIMFSLLVECQDRYKYPLSPIFAILAALGIKRIIQLLKKVIERKDDNMFKFEKSSINFIKKHYFLLLFIVITLLAMLSRYTLRNFESADFIICLKPWFEHLKNNGKFFALSSYIGNYNPPYVTIMAILTYFPIKSLYSIKIVSIIFDFLLAAASGYLVSYVAKNHNKFYGFITYTIILFLPQVLVNSAMWAQCDSMYAFFSIMALIMLLKEKYWQSFVFLGLSFSFKLQFIFILPLYIILYISQNKFTILNFLIIPLVNIILCIPALLVGMPASKMFSSYIGQLGTYTDGLVFNFANIYQLIHINSAYVKYIAIAVTIVLCILLLVYVLYNKVKWNNEKIISLGLLILLLVTYTLPFMHERYLFVGEIISVIYFILYRKNLLLVVLMGFNTLITYDSFLSGFISTMLPTLSIIYGFLIIIFARNTLMLLIDKNKNMKLELL